MLLLIYANILITFYYVMAISFYHKKPVDTPKLTIVAAQTGSGKSNLTAKILREDENYVFVDSDKYKHYRFDAIDISNKYPLLYPFLTGPDGYDHAEITKYILALSITSASIEPNNNLKIALFPHIDKIIKQTAIATDTVISCVAALFAMSLFLQPRY